MPNKCASFVITTRSTMGRWEGGACPVRNWERNWTLVRRCKTSTNRRTNVHQIGEQTSTDRLTNVQLTHQASTNRRTIGDKSANKRPTIGEQSANNRLKSVTNRRTNVQQEAEVYQVPIHIRWSLYIRPPCADAMFVCTCVDLFSRK